MLRASACVGQAQHRADRSRAIRSVSHTCVLAGCAIHMPLDMIYRFRISLAMWQLPAAHGFGRVDGCHGGNLVWHVPCGRRRCVVLREFEPVSLLTPPWTAQTIGTHNSYHVAPPTSVLDFLTSPLITGLLGSNTTGVPDAWEVTMQPLGQQLGNYGALRQFAHMWRRLLS